LTLTLGLALVCLAPAASAADGWKAGAAPVGVAQFSGYTQERAVVAVSDDGQRLATVWETVIGHQIKLRFFGSNGWPLSSELLVNEGLTGHIQDEPMVAMDSEGRTIVCWTDRNGYDGDSMGIFARVYDSAGVAMGPPFVVNDDTTQSQWEPMPAALPDGGWVVAFNGEDDGEAWFRRLEVDGTPIGGDVNMATFHNNGQVDAAVTVDAEGRLFTVFVDYGGNVALFTGTNIFVRCFLPDGTALDPSETLAHNTLLSFDQIDPRLASNRLRGAATVHWMVWQDGGNDGDGEGIFAQRFGMTGAPLGPAWQVNTTTTGDQLLPQISVDHVGNALITWEDRSSGIGRIMTRVYLPDGTPSTGEMEVDATPGAQHRPAVAMTPSGERAWFIFEGPGIHSNPTPAQDSDALLVPWTRPAISFLTPGDLGTTVVIDHDLPGGDELLRVTMASFGTDGIPLPDGRSVPLTQDGLFGHSLLHGDDGLPFQGMLVMVPPGGANLASLTIPSNPMLLGMELHFAALTIKLDEPTQVEQMRHVSDVASLMLQ